MPLCSPSSCTADVIKSVAVLICALTVAPLIIIPDMVWSNFTVTVSPLEMLGYPTMVFSGFMCARESAVGCIWFAIKRSNCTTRSRYG